MNNNMIRKYNVQLVPTIIMLNSDGTQYKRIESSIPKEQLETYIEGLKIMENLTQLFLPKQVSIYYLVQHF